MGTRVIRCLIVVTCLLAHVLHGFTVAPTLKGCYTPSNPRSLSVSAGNYDPSGASGSVCFATCGALDIYSFAAVTSEGTTGDSFCFCGNSLSGAELLSDSSQCSQSCAGGETTCTSNYTLSVFDLPGPIADVSLSCSKSDRVLAVGDASVSFTVNASVSGSASFFLDFGTGARPVDFVGTAMTKSYALPGEYVVKGRVSDPLLITEGESASLTVSVQMKPTTLQLLCPEINVTEEEVCCNASIAAGTYLTATIDFGDSNNDTFGVGDAVWLSAGPGIPERLDNRYHFFGNTEVTIMDTSEFEQDSTILFVEYLAAQAGDIKLLVLSRSCGAGNSYCYRTNRCEASCDPVPCTASQMYSFTHEDCLAVLGTQSPSTVDRYSTKPGDLIVKEVLTITLVYNSESNIVDLTATPVSVNQGDMLGWVTNGGRLAYRSPNSVEKGAWTSSQTITGGTLSSSSISTNRISWVPLIRAVATHPSLLLACHTYLYPGSYQVRLNVSNTLLQESVEEVRAVEIVENINETVIVSEAYGATGESVLFMIEVHTGSNVSYEWHFGDGTSFVTTDRNVSHIYLTRGKYDVNVTASNQLSMKQNKTSIMIQDQIKNLGVSTTSAGSTGIPHPFWLNMSSGSDYSCNWEYDDGAKDVTNETQTPPTGSNWTHVFTEERLYTVSITCRNDVSNDTTTAVVFTLAKILNLQLEKEGALVGEPITINFTIDAGTNATFNLTYDGVYQEVIYDETTKRGQVALSSEAQTGVHVVVITGENVVSREQLVANFTIEERIVNPRCTPIDTTIVLLNGSVTFTCTIDGGTTISIERNYTDNSPLEEFSSALLERWTPGKAESSTHNFSVPGVFTVITKVSNNFDEHVFEHVVKVFNGISGVSFRVDSPAGFSLDGQGPPATVYFEVSGYPPTEASVFFDWGDGLTSSAPFQQDRKYEHRYAVAGNYTVRANVSNIIDSKVFDDNLQSVTRITNMELHPEPRHASVDEPMQMCITLQAGDFVTLSCNFDSPGGAVQTMSKTATSPFHKDCFNHTYTAAGTSTIECIASNPIFNVTMTYSVIAQVPVIPACFEVQVISAPPLPGYLILRLASSGRTDCPAPTNASMEVAWGDGSWEPGLLPLQTTTDWQHRYNTPGRYPCYVRLSNFVSIEEIVPTSQVCGQYEAFGSMVVTPMYQPLSGGPDVRGYGPDHASLPLGRSVSLQVELLSGTPSHFEVHVNGTQIDKSEITECKISCENPIKLNLNNSGMAAGTYTVRVSATNPSDSLGKTFVLHMLAIPAGISIDKPAGIGKPDVDLTFDVTTETVGTDACYSVDFGDGNTELYGSNCASQSTGPILPWQPSMALRHTYVESRMYTLQICGNNSVMILPTCDSLSFPVSSLNCDPPNITLSSQRPLFYQPVNQTRCKGFSLTASVQLANCNGTLSNTKEWTVDKINALTGDIEESIDLSGIIFNLTTINIPARLLEYGTYKFTFKVDLRGSATSFASSVITYVKVTACPLVVSVIGKGISSRMVGYNRTVTLQPLDHSYDPDVIDESKRSEGMVCQFKCRQQISAIESEPWPRTRSGELLEDWSQASVPYTLEQLRTLTEDRGGCFRQGPGLVNSSNSELTFTTANQEANRTYEFEVTCTKGSRSATSSYFMNVVNGDPPAMEIRCLKGLCSATEEGLVLKDPNNNFRLQSVCISCQDDSSDLSYQWRVYYQGLGESKIEAYELPRYTKGTQSANIAIEAAFLRAKFKEYGAHYPCIVQLAVRRNGGTPSTTTMVILINTPPTPGTCDLTPTSGFAGETTTTITCSGWSDDQALSKFTVYASYPQGTAGSVYKSQIAMAIPTLTSWTGLLPTAFNGGNSSVVNVTVEVQDTVEGTTVFHLGSVIISMLPPTEATKIAEELDGYISDYEKLIQEGNSEVATKAALVASARLSAISEVYEEEATCSGSAEECAQKVEKFEEQRSNIAVARQQILSGLLKISDPVDVNGLSQVLSVTKEITKSSTQVTMELQEVVTEHLYRMTQKLKDLAEDTPLEDIVAIANSIVQNIGNIMAATRSTSINPVTIDTQRARETKTYIFDSDINSPRIDLSGYKRGEGEQVLAKETLDINLQRQVSRLVIDKVDSSITLITEAILGGMIPGEDPVSIVTGNNDTILNIETNLAAKVLNRETPISDDSSVFLPPLAALEGGSTNSSENGTTISVMKYYVKTNPYYNVQNVHISMPVIRLELYQEDNTPKTVENASHPVVISLLKGRLELTGVNLEENRTTPLRNGEIDPATGLQTINSTGSPHISHTVNLTGENKWASVIFDLYPEDASACFMVITQCNGIPGWNLTRPLDWNYQLLNYLPNTNQTVPFRWIVDNGRLEKLGCYETGSSDTVNVTSKLYQINSTTHATHSLTGLPLPHDLVQTLNTTYQIKNEIVGCYFLNTDAGIWQQTQLSRRVLDDSSTLHCESSHLTSFGAGAAVTPNIIDWGFVFSNLDFYKNMTIYITEIVIFVLYLVAAALARRYDKKDIEKLGLAPLIDNKVEDKYLYEIVISTGHRRNAGTASNVYMTLSGDYDETDVLRIATPCSRKPLQRGATDGLLFATHRPLGALSYMRVWHDNSGKGKSASWYLKHVFIQDLQTKQKFVFLCNQWLAVEEGDGQIDRVIPVAGSQQLTEFAQLFAQASQKNLGDDHLWYSVVARPPESRFTRLQRVSCCLLLLFSNMLANGVFYERAKGGTTKPFTLGPFTLTLEQLYVGMMTNFIVFPINFLVVQLFRKSPPRRKRKSRVEDALKCQKTYLEGQSKDGHDEGGEQQPPVWPTPRSTTGIELDTYGGERHGSEQQSGSPTPAAAAQGKKKRKCQLPWWGLIIAWILLWLGVLTSAFFVTSYAISFGDEKVKKWLTSMVVSFATSILLTQPLQVLLMAMLFSLIFKKSSIDREEAEEDEEPPPLQTDEEWILPDPQEGYLDARPRQAAHKPLDEEQVQKARENRLKELKMFDIIREIIFYCMFLWLLLVVSYHIRPSLGFAMKDEVRANFIDQGLGHIPTFMEDLRKVASHRQFWDWLEVTFIPGLRSTKWYNGDWLPGARGFLADRANRIMGYATMRQLRIHKNACSVVEYMSHTISECNIPYNVWQEDTSDYGVGWESLVSNNTYSNAQYEYTYRTGPELDSYPFWGDHGFYGGGGYVAELTGSIYDLEEKMARLRRGKWIDKYTRAIFIEFTTYNPGVNLFSIVTILAESITSGGIIPSYRVEPVYLLSYYGSTALFEIITQSLFGAFIIFFLIKEIRNIYREKKQYFTQFWNWVEMLIVLLSVASAGIFLYRLVVVYGLTQKFKETHGNGYIKFQYVGYWQELLLYMVAWLVFLANLKFLKLLRFNKRMSMLACTLREGAKPLFMFFLMFSIVFSAFVQFFYFVYQRDLNNFKTVIHSVETCIQMMLGRFNFYAMHSASPMLGSIFFFIYVVSCTFVLVNMFVSILNESFSRVREDLSLQSNDHEMVDFILQRFKASFGLANNTIGTTDDSKDSASDPKSSQYESDQYPHQQLARGVQPPLAVTIKRFPERVDRLLSCISKIMFFENLHEKVYFDQASRTQDGFGESSSKEAFRRLQSKDELRRLMARLMLSAHEDVGDIRDVQRDFDMI